MMPAMLRFREDPILHEQVRLLRRNYTMGTLAMLLVSGASTYGIYAITGKQSVLHWFVAMLVLCLAMEVQLWWEKRRKSVEPATARRAAQAFIARLFLMGACWSLLAPLYLGDDLIVLTIIVVMTCGLAAGAVSVSSPCLPVYVAFMLPMILSLALTCFVLGGPLNNALGVATLVYMFATLMCAWYFESSVNESISLRFANLELIEELRLAKGEAEEANRAKSVFLASASHDLRQPIHAMGLFIEALGDTPPARQGTILSHINAASEAARDMLDTLLNFSKLEAGVIEPVAAPFPLQSLFGKLERELAFTANNKGLVYRTRDTPWVVHADPTMVELILRNLIVNAIRYTEHGGVLVACRKRGDQGVVEVWDTGIGIAPQEQRNIFREFHQLQNPERDRSKGFGLGLAIVKGLAERMQSQISVSSCLGTGSVFRLPLPLSSAPVVEDMPANEPVPSFPGRRVLVIDDDRSILAAMGTLLNAWGCECVLAESAQEAVARCGRENRLDLMISDYRLREGRTGKDAIAMLRAHLGRDVPAILITGDTAPDRMREARSSDALLLHKPVCSSQLLRAMAAVLTVAGTG